MPEHTHHQTTASRIEDESGQGAATSGAENEIFQLSHQKLQIFIPTTPKRMSIIKNRVRHMLPSDASLNRYVAVLVFSVAVVLGAATVPAAAEPGVAVTSVSVSSEEVETGDTVYVEPTIETTGGGGYVDISEIDVSAESWDGRRATDVDDIGTIASGATVSPSVGIRFDTEGNKRVRVTVRGTKRDADGSTAGLFHVGHSTFIEVDDKSEPDPRVQINTDDVTLGVGSDVKVTVTNGGNDRIKDLDLSLQGTEGSIDTETKHSPTLGAFSSEAFVFDVTASSPRTVDLRASLEYDDGTVADRKAVAVKQPDGEMSAYAALVDVNRSGMDGIGLEYRVTNRGDTPLEDVSLSGETDMGHPLPGVVIEEVPGTTSVTKMAYINERPEGTVDLEASYEVAGEESGYSNEIVVSYTDGTTVGGETEDGAKTDVGASGGGTADEAGLKPFVFFFVGAAAVGTAVLGYRSHARRRD